MRKASKPFKSLVYKKLINLLIKKGKKQKIKQIVDKSLEVIKRDTAKSFSYIFLKLFKRLRITLEIRRLSLRRREYIIPFTIKLRRRVYLTIKWLLITISKNHANKSFSSKFIYELLRFYYNKKSYLLQLKEQNSASILKNRANIHFRW